MVIVVGAYTGYKYLYKSHRDIKTEVASVKVDAKELVGMFALGNTESILNKTV